MVKKGMDYKLQGSTRFKINTIIYLRNIKEIVCLKYLRFHVYVVMEILYTINVFLFHIDVNSFKHRVC